MINKKPSAWKRAKLKAPKVPDITCPIIDDIIRGLETLRDEGKVLNKTNTKSIMRKLEKIRTANELLRDGGEYWYLLAKKHLSRKKIL
jgi:hypothetical protein